MIEVLIGIIALLILIILLFVYYNNLLSNKNEYLSKLFDELMLLQKRQLKELREAEIKLQNQ